MKPRLVAVFVLGCSLPLGVTLGCATARYEPEPVRHGLPLPGDAFDRAIEVVRTQYRRVVVADREDFRIETDWHPFQPGDLPGQRRAFVFRGDDGYLRVVVEHFFDRMGSLGPERTAPRGDRRSEEELAGALERELARAGG